MMSLVVGVLILVPVVGALIYAFFALDNKKAARGKRITAFGEAPDDTIEPRGF